MFYEEEKINDIIKCPLCMKMFDDPRMVECGESMCNSCIMLLLNKEKTGLNFKVWNAFHEMPKNGFKKNHRLIKLIAIKPNEVSRSIVASDLKSELTKVYEKNSIMQTNLICISNRFC